MKCRSIITVLLSLLALAGISQTTISDSTYVSGNWTLANSPYIIEGRAIVASGQSLIIEPGVEVRLRSSASPSNSWFEYESGNVGVIRVKGEIIANGTAAQPILFTRNNTGYWGTILIDATASSTCSLSNCIIEYAKESRYITGINSPSTFYGGISIYKSAPVITQNIFRNNNMSGIYIREVLNVFDFSSNTFHDNGASGTVIEQSMVHSINNTYYNNSFTSSGSVSAIRSSNANTYMVGNLIYNNDDFGIFTLGSGSHYIINCTIIGNYQGIRIEDATTYISNSIIQDNNINFATSGAGASASEMEYSLTNDATFPANLTDKGGNILNSAALFTSISADDFSLTSNSPAIDAGKPDVTGLNIPALDILGNPRIDNNTIDMGAVEFQHPNAVINTEGNNGIIVYPNPASDIVKIVTNEDVRISVYSAEGKILGTYSSKEIDLTNYSRGLYILKIENTRGDIVCRKIVKE